MIEDQSELESVIVDSAADAVDRRAIIRDALMATKVAVEANKNETTIRTVYEGFVDAESAFGKIADIATMVDDMPSVDSVHAGVDTGGTPDGDTRPHGWVNINLEP